MPAPQLDLSGFSRKIATSDLARSNLYSVVFSSFNNKIKSDGTLDTDIPSDKLQATPANRAADVASDILMSQSQLFRTITGAYAPEIVRGIFGADYLSFLGESYDISRDIGMMVKTVVFPGASLDITKNQLLRKPHNVVTSRTNENCTMTFYMTPGHAERHLFLTWLDSIFDSKTGVVDFYNNYARSIEIFAYDRTGQARTRTMLHEAFPIRIGEVQMDSSSNNEIATFEVEFNYAYMTNIEVLPSDKPILEVLTSGDINGIVNTGQSVISRSRNIKDALGL